MLYFLNIRIKILYIYIYNIRSSTSSNMVYGEVGKLPLQVTFHKRHNMSFWLCLMSPNRYQSKQLIHTKIKDVVFHNWYTYISTFSMCTMNILFKKQLNFEDYMLSCNYRETNFTNKIPICKQQDTNLQTIIYV